MVKIDDIKNLATEFHPEEIARRLNINVKTVRYHLKKHSILTPNGKFTITIKIQESIIALAKSGLHVQKIAETLKISPNAVKQHLKRAGITPTDGTKTQRVSDEKNLEIVKLAQAGVSKTRIQKITGVNKIYIQKYCSKMGIRLTPGTFRKYSENDAIAMLNQDMELTGNESRGFYEMRCKTHHDIVRHRPISDFYQGCPTCSNLKDSKGQREVSEFVSSLGLDVINNHKCLVDENKRKAQEIDIFIPEKNIGIEYCGLHWHSDSKIGNKPKDYHHKKMLIAKAMGIRLITVFEDEWINRPDQIKGFLQSVLNKSNETIYARECTVSVINKEIAKMFLNKNHIQGYARGTTVAFGLFHREHLVAVITGGRHHRGNASEALILDRLCVISGMHIPGAASKLLKSLRKYAADNGHNKIVSWSDNRWSEGNVYKTLGFALDGDLSPDYSYTKNRKRFSKQSCTKTNLRKRGGIGQTEPELATSLGYNRIYDCGKKRWVLDI
jgi:DNA-binding CsgD family transcriptional regulator